MDIQVSDPWNMSMSDIGYSGNASVMRTTLYICVFIKFA